MKPFFDAVFTGDLMLGEWHFSRGFGINKVLGRKGSDCFFQPIKPRLREGKLVIGNLEGPIAPGREARRKPLLADESILPALKDAGFLVLSIANNHLMEYGEKRATYTIERLEDSGFIVIGLADKPSRIIKLNGFKVEIIAADILPVHHSRPPYPEKVLMYSGKLDEIGAEICLLLAKSCAERKIVYLHWGEEFIHQPCPLQIKWAHRFIDSGADAVIGCHPHVPQGIEIYKDKVIAYSLGNFISDMPYPLTKEGFALGLRFSDEREIEYEAMPYYIDDTFRPYPIEGGELDDFHRRLEEFSNFIYTKNSFEDEMTRYGKAAHRAEEELWEWVKGFYRRNILKYPLSVHWGWLKEKLGLR
ncbi:MAG: CapA family protein [candidate division Zixibacteria bacterium]|nr:CapA family protein [Candidatus Tariuqbacter arcticus]